MANNFNKNFEDDVVDVKQQSLYARLKRLFSTDVIIRNVGGKQLKIKDTDEIQYATDRNSFRDRWNRVRSTAVNAYNRDFALSYQAARLDLFRDYDCIGPDTIIPLPDGTHPTISELVEKYKDKPEERFFIFSYDHETDSIKLGRAYHPRKKDGGARKAWKVVFDNGQSVVGSAGHPFLMRNGEYKKLEDLSVGESVMPFYQKDFYNNGYRSIYNFSKGWQSEHVIVAEQFERPLNDNEVVHHKNFDKTNNLPSNLKIMTDSEHRSFHMNLNNNVIWSSENKQKTITKIQLSDGYKNRKCHKWNGERFGENNPFYGKKHSNKSNEKRSNSLKTSLKNRNQFGFRNPNSRNDISFDIITDYAFNYYKQFGKLDIYGLSKYIGCDYSTIHSRLIDGEYSWNNFKSEIVSTLNHKIISIEYVGEIEVYDVTVEKYQNFATDSCFVHNTMDMDPIISTVLDIYADECLTENEMGEMLTIDSKNNNIKEILHNLFYDILNVEFNLWSWIRNTCKYGDFYLKLNISPEYGVYLVEPMSAYNVERIENSDPLNKNYVKFQVRPVDTSQAEILESFQVAHFRLLSDSNFLPYGKSMIESGRRVWKQLSLLEDAMLIHRIMRAPEKRIFKIDVGNIPPNEVDNFMEQMISKMKKVPYIDERTGDYNLRFNLMNMVEDIWLPTRGQDSGTSIDTLPGMEFTGIDDLEYVKNKMLAAFKVPKPFITFDENTSGKATLSAEDVRFSRTISRIQKMVIAELNKIAAIHLYAQGYKDASIVDFNISLTNPSTVFEREKMEIWAAKMENAKSMWEMSDSSGPFFARDFVYKKIFKMSDDDIQKNNQSIIEDCKQLWRMKQITEDGNDPAKPFKKINPQSEEGGSEESGGLGGSPSGGPPDLGGEMGDIGGEEPSTGTGGDESSSSGEGPVKEVVVLEKQGEPADDYVRPSQEGEKQASNYPRGEDPLGDIENKRDFESDRTLSNVVKKKPLPLTLEMGQVIKNLNSFMISSQPKEKPTNHVSKSILDENNIL